MSRRQNKSPVPIGGPPPSHPQEAYTEHRSFLIRSLDRCDVEIAALIELNKSLHSIKKGIIAQCGEATLLDIGEGLLKLDHEEKLEGKIPKSGKTLCIDFMLRMKLRRRILNRLARRLNRLSHSMDGRDVSPPPPPKYGDLRLHVDAQTLNAFEEKRRVKEIARQRIESLRSQGITPPWTSSIHEQGHSKYVSDDDELMSDSLASNRDVVSSGPTKQQISSAFEQEYSILKEYNESYEKRLNLTTGAIRYALLDKPFEEDFNNIKWGAGIGATHRTLSSREKEEEFKRWQASLLTTIPDQPTFEDLGLEERVFHLDKRRKRVVEESTESPPPSPSKKAKKTQGSPKKAVKDDDDEEKDTDDAELEENGVEKSAEEGDEEMKETDEEADGSEKVKSTDEEKKKEEGDDEDEEGDDEDEDGDDEEDKDDDSDEEDMDEDDDDNDDEEEEAKRNKEVVDEALLLRRKPISLAPIPSFHNQDSKRIRNVHEDLMASSMHEHARRRIAEVTNDYNHAFRQSNEYYNRRVKVQEDLNSIMTQNRMELSKLKNEYAMQVAIGRARWEKRRQEWRIQRAKKSMQGMYGQMPMGTNHTQRASAHHDQLYNHIGHLLGTMVDVVVLRVERGYDDDQFEDFNPPPPPNVHSFIVDHTTGETLSRRHERREGGLRNSLDALTQRLQQSEEERKRAWRKMMKTKAEFEMPRRGRLDMNQINLLPVPPLRASTTAAVPNAATFAAAYPSFVTTPYSKPRYAATVMTGSDSKYSAAKVRERISSDGTVMPVSEPKKNKDGLYQRPAGRTRKGMNWDAVRGIWVPAEH